MKKRKQQQQVLAQEVQQQQRMRPLLKHCGMRVVMMVASPWMWTSCCLFCELFKCFMCTNALCMFATICCHASIHPWNG